MAKRQRNYRAEYERRKAKARTEGFQGYSQKRRAKERFESEPDLRLNWQRRSADVPDQPLFPEDDPETFALWYRAFYDSKESKRRDRDSARAQWFVNVTGQVASFDDWQERYGPK